MNIGTLGMLESLKRIARLADAWPSDAELLADARHGQWVKVQATHRTDALPFGLDRIDNTQGQVRTRAGAVAELHAIWESWGKPRMPESYRQADPYTALCASLVAALPSLGERLSGENMAASEERLERLARDCERQTATGLEPAGIACPACARGDLGRPNTSEGLAAMYVCERCGASYSETELQATGRAQALYGDADNVLLTLTEASQVLGIPLKTLHSRVTRHNIRPAQYRGNRKAYRLSELR